MPDSPSPKLADLLRHRQETIGTAWTERVRRMTNSHYQALPAEDLQASIHHGLSAIITSLASDSYDSLEAYLLELSQLRLKMGFGIQEVVEVLLIWKDLTLEVVRQALPQASAEADEAMHQADDRLHYLISRFSQIYAEAMQAEVRAQQTRTALVLQALETASGSLQLNDVLARIADGIVTAADVRFCGIYLLDAARAQLVPRVAQGAFGGEQLAAFYQRTLDPQGDPWLAERLHHGMPVMCSSLETEARPSLAAVRALGLRSALVVPVQAGKEVLGLALVCPAQNGSAFEPAQIEMIWGIANAVALAIQNARLVEEMQHGLIVQERQRLARELHDSVTQSLYSVLLYADAAATTLRASSVPEALANLAELKATALGALREMRLLIFELRPSAIEAKGLAEALRDRLESVEARSGLQYELEAQGEDALPMEARLELYRIVQEALNNVLKHAQARQVTLALQFAGSGVELRLDDDGVGFDFEAGARSGGLGLRGMRERAERLGARLAIETRPGQGTHVRLAYQPQEAELWKTLPSAC